MDQKTWESFVYDKNMDEEKAQGFYVKWSETYDHDMDTLKYAAPKLGAEKLAERFPQSERATVQILDVAAGTGLVGVGLKNVGFEQLDALDGNQPMLDKLQSLDIYKKTFCCMLGQGRSLESIIPNGTYDAAIICGGFAQAHLPIEAIREVARTVKKGGFFLNLMSLKYLTIVDSLHGLEPLMEQMEREGVWSKLERTVYPNNVAGIDGVIHMYRIL